jgi:hypothetical protein
MLAKIYGHKKGTVTRGGKELHSQKVYKLHALPNIIKVQSQ